MESGFSKKLFLGLCGLTVVFTLLILGMTFYPQIFSQKIKSPPMRRVTTPTPQKTGVPLGVQKAQTMAGTYPQLLKRTSIYQQFEGILRAKGENSWTLEKDAQLLTLTQEEKGEIRYGKIATSGAKPVEITPQDLKIGDLVSVTQIINFQTGKARVVVITVLLPR